VEVHTVSYLTPYKMIGEDDIMHPNDDGQYKYSVSVKCITQTGRLLFIKKSDFIKWLQPTTAWQVL